MKKDTIILIAEDDAGHATLIRRHLKRAGIKNPVEYFNNGEEVLNFLLEKSGLMLEHYILVLDLHMPRIDGLEVLRKLRLNEQLINIPVVVITTTDDPDELSRCTELGCAGYISKTNFEKLTAFFQQLDS